MATLPPEISSIKPFEMLADQFSAVAAAYKTAQSPEERRQLLAVMRLIIDEADSLHRVYSENFKFTD
jgi:hypothetical protein